MSRKPALLAVCLLAFTACDRPAPVPKPTVSSKGPELTVAVTKENFRRVVMESKQPVLVDFWAPWCGWCLKLAPTLEELAAEYQGRATIAKVNTDAQECTGIAEQFNVQGLPTLILFKDGRIVATIEGYEEKPVLAEKLNQALKSPT